MQDVEYLRKKGITVESLKAKFTAKDPDEKIKKLVELHRDRIQKAVDQNMRESPHYWAIDRAIDAAQRNIPHIQARELAESGKNQEEIVRNFKYLGIEGMLEDMVDQNGNIVRDAAGLPVKCFNKPVFETVFVPLVAAYRTIRLAKLFNDRNVFPRYKYSPARMTVKDMIVSEIITSRISRMTSDMGYGDDDKQAIRQMLDYGYSIAFTREAYYTEKYITMEGGKEVEKVAREGVRFTIPHPTRCFYDRLYHLASLNSDSGVTYCGFWDIIRYSEIANEDGYWNTENIAYGASYPFLGKSSWSVYQEFYPCNVKFPVFSSNANTEGAGTNDRLNDYARYTSADGDAAVTRVVMFEKLVPSKYGLGDYDFPVWFKFVYADTGTNVYAEPIAYTPAFAMTYDYDFNRVMNTSLSLELTPFQQLLGMFLTQHFLSVKRNLLRAYYVNNDLIPKADIDKINREGEKLYTRSLLFLNYSKGADSVIGQNRDREAISPVPTGNIQTNETAGDVQMILGVVERMLGYSPQEVGASATHEITAAEANITNFNTSVRTEYIGTGVDAGVGAKKRILYDAMYCYGSDEVFAEVADLTPEREKALKELGFEIEEGTPNAATKAGVKGKKGVLKLQTFISEREGINRINDSKIGVAMLQMLSVALQNESLFASVGSDQFLTLLNYVLRMMGLPEDFRLKPVSKEQQPGNINPEEIRKSLIEAVNNVKQQIVQEAMKAVGEQVKTGLAEPIQKEMQVVAQSLQALNQKDQQLEQAVVQLAQNDQEAQAALSNITQAIQQLGMQHAAIVNAQPQVVGGAPPTGGVPLA